MSEAHSREVPGPVFAPVTHRIQNRASSCVQRPRHVRVPFVGDVRRAGEAFVEAVVVLCPKRSLISRLSICRENVRIRRLTQIIDAPVGVGLGIDLFVTQRAESPAACVCSGVAVDAELKFMDGQSLFECL